MIGHYMAVVDSIYVLPCDWNLSVARAPCMSLNSMEFSVAAF